MEIENKTKKFSRNNHARAISSKFETQAEQKLRVKMQTPFWIPNNNSDLFIVKKILNEDKELKRDISNGKFKKSRNNLHEAFTQDRTKIVSSTLYNPVSVLDKIQQDRQNSLLEKNVNNLDKYIEQKTQGIAQFNGDKISDFILKLRQHSLLKYTMNVKKERILREEETYQNELESIKDSIFSMEKAKSNFENELSIKFDKYIKFLSVEKEKEKNDLENMLYKKSKIDSTIKQLENKKNKQREKLEQYKEYKLFLISIKERDLSILCKKDPLEKPPKRNNTTTFLTQPSEKKSFNKKRDAKSRREDEFHFQINQNDTSINIERLINKYSGKVYEEPNDLIEEIKNLETLNIDLLQKNNELSEIYFENSKELNNVLKEDSINLHNLKNDTNKKEKELKELNDRNKRNREEKELLLLYSGKNTSINKSSASTVSVTKSKIYKMQLYSKINYMYNVALNLQFNKEQNVPLEIPVDKGKVKQKLDFKTNTQIEMLRLIEKTFDILSDKYIYFYEISYSELKKFEKELEVERKKKFTDDQKIETEKKKDTLIEKILERYNKATVIPRRKVAENLKPSQKQNNDVKLSTLKLDELKFEDLIFYEDGK